jgi:hypothetical protein
MELPQLQSKEGLIGKVFQKTHCGGEMPGIIHQARAFYNRANSKRRMTRKSRSKFKVSKSDLEL